MRIPLGRPAAAARLSGEGKIRGIAAFYPQPEGILVCAEIAGLPENESGFYAFHIHEGFYCTGKNFADTGSHYNPRLSEHPRHAGDLPALLGCRGSAFLAVLTDRFTLPEVLGRTVVIHSDADDFHTQPAGNAGEKIACGVIRAIRY